jgi:hypothetical protein
MALDRVELRLPEPPVRLEPRLGVRERARRRLSRWVRPSTRREMTQASSSTRRCFVTAGLDTRSPAVAAPTVVGPAASRSTIVRRTGWERARIADGHDSLFVYHFMFRPGPSGDPLEVPCPVCTSIIDGIDGIARHVAQRASVAVIAKAPVERFAAHARSRGRRNLRLLSSVGTSFNADYRAEGDGEEQFAMATVFTRREGRIHHFWSSELWYEPAEPAQHKRHVDLLWPMWAIFDRLPEGRDPDWMPSLGY